MLLIERSYAFSLDNLQSLILRLLYAIRQFAGSCNAYYMAINRAKLYPGSTCRVAWKEDAQRHC